MSNISKIEKISPEEKALISRLIADHRQSLIRAVARNMGTTDLNDINDCLQEVFLLALQNAKKLAAHPNPVGWLHKTAFNIAHDMRRSADQRRVMFLSSEDVIHLMSDHAFEEKCIERMERKTFNLDERKQEIFSKLSIRELDLYHLRFVEKQSYAYIAERYHTTEGCVRAWFSQMKKRIYSMVYKNS